MHVFLTGGTGYLGAFLLRELLDRGDARVHCLVRAPDAPAARARLRANLERFDLWDETSAERIVPIAGDVTRPRLGLTAAEFDALAERIDAVFHAAAVVHWLSPVETLEAPNVDGVRGAIALALRGRAKPLHHISTTRVFPQLGAPHGAPYRESDSLDDGRALLDGYSLSKLVGEKQVAEAMERGLRAAIYRPTAITGDSRSGASHTRNDIVCSMIKGCIQMGIAPALDGQLDVVPVDYVARAIARLSQDAAALGKIFHLVNPQPIRILALIEWIVEQGYPLEIVDYEEWRNVLRERAAREPENALKPFVPVFDILDEKHVAPPPLDRENTDRLLAGTDVACPAADGALFRTYFDYFVRSGFLPPPATPAGGSLRSRR